MNDEYVKEAAGIWTGKWIFLQVDLFLSFLKQAELGEKKLSWEN